MPHVRLSRCLTTLAAVLLFPAPSAAQIGTQTAVFAGGCFWGIEAVFEHTRGVLSAVSGYTGGHTKNPSYGDVITETTGHAESVRVTYDPSQVTYEQLLAVFFAVHDPTQLNRQGPDVGPSYRSAIFYADPGQRAAADEYLARLTREQQYRKKIVTTLEPLVRFYEAEGYHQNYLARHPDQPYIVYNDLPKLALLQRGFPVLWRDETTEPD